MLPLGATGRLVPDGAIPGSPLVAVAADPSGRGRTPRSVLARDAG